MKVIYDAATDILQIVFKDATVEDFNEEQPGMMVNYDADDNIIAIEISHASKLTTDPRSLQHIVVNDES